MLINHFKEENRERCVVESFQVCLRWNITVPVLRRNIHFLLKNMTLYWSRLLILELPPSSNLQWKDVSTTFLKLQQTYCLLPRSTLSLSILLIDLPKSTHCPPSSPTVLFWGIGRSMILFQFSVNRIAVPEKSHSAVRLNTDTANLLRNSSKWPIESQKEWKAAGVCLVERSVKTELA